MFAVFIQHNLQFRINSHFMKFYETVLFMSRCSPSPKQTKQQQLWPAPSKSKEEVKWFSWLVGWFICRILGSDRSFDQDEILPNFPNEFRIMYHLVYKSSNFCQ